MMMIGEESHRSNPTVQVPPWTLFDESAAGVLYQQQPVSGVSGVLNGGDYSPYLLNETLKRFLPSNDTFVEDGESDVSDFPVDVYSCDDFRMYEFKVRRCNRGRSHDWTECPFAHPGEKARRRDPRKYHYSGTACPDFRKGSCKRGDSCEFAHGVFECWLHPARYRTQVCKDGTSCRRRVCFFAHTAEQLRVLPQQSPKVAGISQFSTESYDGSPLRQALDANPFYPKSTMLSSPTSTLLSPPLSPPSDSPPLSPLRRSFPSNSVNEVLLSLRQLQLSKAKSYPSWGVNCGFASPKGINVSNPFGSVPSTPTTNSGWLDRWDRSFNEEEPMERVESGRDLRNKIFQKLSKENSVDVAASVTPDVGWVSELVK